ncbi:MAG: M23 family metallopeptidase [Bacteroidota bacterium]
MKKLFPLLMLFIVACSGMKELPKEKYYSFLYNFSDTYEDDTISFYLKNPVKCPVNIYLRKDTLNPTLAGQFGRIILESEQDTTIRIYHPDFDKTSRIRYNVNYGDYTKPVRKSKIAFPFPTDLTYKIIQGYNGQFSHNKFYSRYAIDFSLQIGDTITSADDGYVVGVIEGYKDFGTSQAWRNTDKSNYLTLYHPHSRLFTQYVHLDHEGAIVELGDYVTKGQAIGICGMTGFTTTPHLHFNVRVPTEKDGFISTSIEFENDIRGSDLKRKMKVKR